MQDAGKGEGRGENYSGITRRTYLNAGVGNRMEAQQSGLSLPGLGYSWQVQHNFMHH